MDNPNVQEPPQQVNPTHSHLIPIVLTGVIMLGIGLASGYFLFSPKQRNLAVKETITISPTIIPTVFPTTVQTITQTSADTNTPYSIVSIKSISPDGKYSFTQSTVGDKNTISIKDSKGTIIESDVVQTNYASIGYGTKFQCQCGETIKGWTQDSQLILDIVNGGGEEYQILIDPATGKADLSAFRKIK